MRKDLLALAGALSGIWLSSFLIGGAFRFDWRVLFLCLAVALAWIILAIRYRMLIHGCTWRAAFFIWRNLE